MELLDYQLHAVGTALPRALDVSAYLVPFIIGETGELFGKFAKAHRDEWAEAKLEEELVSEYGDIAWGTAVLLWKLQVSRTDYKFVVQDDPRTSLLYQASRLLAADIDPNEPTWLDDAAEALWFALRYHCEAVTGRSFDYVLSMNVQKLASRAARGVLAGSGDHR